MNTSMAIQAARIIEVTMALIVLTNDPKGLLERLKQEIKENEITTWKFDSDGDLEYKAEQYSGRAWLRPYLQQGAVSFGLVGQEGITMTKAIYGIYHGRFTETLLTHFDADISSVQATAMGTKFDSFKAAAK